MARALATADRRAVRAGPALQVHGGVRRAHPHDLQARAGGLPARERSTLVHGPGCPVCVIPMGRVDDAIAIAERDDVILTSFGDMMRVPGGRGSFFDSKARGADIRMVYSPLDALKIARQNPDKRVVFMAIGFETTAPSTAMTVLRAARRGPRELLDLLQPRHDHPGHQGDPGLARPAARRVHRARPRVDGDRVPAVRVHRPGLRQAAGRAPGSSRWTSCSRSTCCMLQLAEGRCEIENQYGRVVPWDGNLGHCR